MEVITDKPFGPEGSHLRLPDGSPHDWESNTSGFYWQVVSFQSPSIQGQQDERHLGARSFTRNTGSLLASDARAEHVDQCHCVICRAVGADIGDAGVVGFPLLMTVT